MTNEPITIRETANERYARTTTGRCDPKTEQRIAVITARQTGTDPLGTDIPGAVVHCRKATDAEIADFDARTRRLAGSAAPLPEPVAPRPVRPKRSVPAGPLTTNDVIVWRAIAASLADHDAPPSRRELHRRTALGSLDTVTRCLDRLTAAGIVRIQPGIHRAIVLLEHPVPSADPAQEAA